MLFRQLFDAETGGSQIGPVVQVNDVTVTDGLFDARIDLPPLPKVEKKQP